MVIASTVERYLHQNGFPFELCERRRPVHDKCSRAVAGWRGGRVASSMLIKEAEGFLLVVSPGLRRPALRRVARLFGSDVHRATDDEMAWLFSDCDVGALPIFGWPYGVGVVFDAALREQSEVLCCAGSGGTMIRLDGPIFRRMTEIERAPWVSLEERILHLRRDSCAKPSTAGSARAAADGVFFTPRPGTEAKRIPVKEK